MSREPDPPEDQEPFVLPVSHEIDLHTFHPRDVADVVASFLETAVEAGLAEVRIVHGRGIGAQRETVRKVLARCAEVEEFSDAPPELGGWGATIARLRPRGR